MRWWTPQHVLVVAAGLCHAAPSQSFIENDSIVFPEDNVETQNKLDECLEENFKIPVKGECYDLLTTNNVCPEGSWLVLDLEPALRPTPIVRPVCRRKQCPAKSDYWPPLKRCVNQKESASLCPTNNVVKTDVFGDGMCGCRDEPVQSKDKTGVCHIVYSRGPCDPGRVWMPGDRCVQDPCPETRARFPDKLVVPWTDGRCYSVEERGPCSQGHVVRINKYTMQPECNEPLAVLHLVNPPCSGFDHQGVCKPSVTTPQNYFYSQLASQAKNKKARKAEPK